MQKAIIFIDGNNLYHNVKALDVNPNRINFKKLVELICSDIGVELKKTFYYNSVPNIITIGEEKYYKHMEFLSGLEKLGIKVKIRKLQHKSNYELISKKLGQLQTIKLCDSCKPVVKQNCINCIGSFQEKEKGIDVMIAIDMIKMALEKEYDIAILISGDGDFVPVCDLVKQCGKEVFSVSVSKGYSSDLKKTQRHRHIDKLLFESIEEEK